MTSMAPGRAEHRPAASLGAPGWSVCVSLVVLLGSACGRSTPGTSGGTGGRGSIGTGGASAGAASGGATGDGTSGSSGTSGTGGATDGGASDRVCQMAQLKFDPKIPTVFVLVDRSGTVFTNDTTGIFFTLRTAVLEVVQRLQAEVRFGLGVFT